MPSNSRIVGLILVKCYVGSSCVNLSNRYKVSEDRCSEAVLFWGGGALEPQFGPWPTSMKLSVSLRFSRS
jgi:hypothetical protein